MHREMSESDYVEFMMNDAEVQARQAEVHNAILDAISATARQRQGGAGVPWVQPTGAHDAYALDAIVTDDGKTWRSIIPYNAWRPGITGWVEEP